MKFLLNDVVAKDNNTGRVIELQNRVTREPFLMVQISAGPLKGKREYPYHGWRPVLDWSPDGRRAQCTQCYREYRREISGEPKLYCRTCAPSARTEPDPEDDGLTVGELRDMLHRPWRQRESNTAQYAPVARSTEPVHAHGCLCATTSKCTPF